MRENYKAWDIDFGRFFELNALKEKLGFLINFAVLAPSSHNSQPWQFEVGSDHIIIKPDFTRALTESDRNHRQLYISLGCALENILIAADYYDLKAAVSYEVAGGRKFVKINFTDSGYGSSASNKEHPALYIPKRRTNRNNYRDIVPEKFIEYAKNSGNQNLCVNVVIDEPTRTRIAEVVVEANITAMEDAGFRNELARYVKSNITNSKIGMPAFGMGLPLIPSLVAPWLVKKVNINKRNKKKDLKLLRRHTPVFVILSTAGDREDDWIETGQMYEKLSLTAAVWGVSVNPMAGIIQIGEFYKKLQTILGLTERPQFFFRAGLAEKVTPPSPRMPAKEVMTL